MSNVSTTVLAPAKINLALAIKGRMDNGFHDIETIFQTVSLFDRVHVELKGHGILCECGVLSGEKNLAYIAALKFLYALEAQNGKTIKIGCKITIEKNIPLQAGLAGGSADAAAVLRALNRLFANPFTYEELLQLAAQCGSDTAFCLKGGTQWGEGRGTQLTEFPAAPEMNVLIVKPDKGINTKEAYQLFREWGKFTTLNKEYWRKTLESGVIEKIGEMLSNSLEEAGNKLVPEIQIIKKLLLKGGCRAALMSGSGSAVFGILRDKDQGKEIGKLLSQTGFHNYWIVKTIGVKDFSLIG